MVGSGLSKSCVRTTLKKLLHPYLVRILFYFAA